MVYFVSDLLCTLKAENLKKTFSKKTMLFPARLSTHTAICCTLLHTMLPSILH